MSYLAIVLFSLVLFCNAADPDQYRNTKELITSKGYPVMEYYITTADSYILSVLRMPSNKGSRKPVILQHGILDSSDAWVLNFPEQSLAFILYDLGYDVWLSNSRGNTYSKKHVSTGISSSEYWDFSYDEMGMYDVPALIEFVKRTTGFPKVSYVAHSQGSTQMFVNLVSDKSVASSLNVFVALAPVVYLSNTQSILLKALAVLQVADLLNFFQLKEFTPSSKLMTWLLPATCSNIADLCNSALYALVGSQFHALNQTRWGVYSAHFPAGTSTVNMCHWSQAIRSGKFASRDKGWIYNLWNYQQFSPPVYDLKKATGVPIALLYGSNDLISTPQDIQKLISELPQGSVIKQVKYDGMGHVDFLWSPKAASEIYSVVIDLLQKTS